MVYETGAVDSSAAVTTVGQVSMFSKYSLLIFRHFLSKEIIIFFMTPYFLPLKAAIYSELKIKSVSLSKEILR